MYYCDFEDCFQNAVIGFLNAVEKYDVTSPENFSSYFQLWLIQNMSRECVIDGTIIRYPVHYKDKLMTVMANVSGAYYGPDELVRAEQNIIDRYEGEDDYTGIYKKISKLFEECFMDEYVNAVENRFDYSHILPFLPLFDEFVIEDDFTKELIDDLEAKFLRKTIDSCLSDREKEVIIMRYGIYDGVPRTLEEVGVNLGVTRERIRQIEKKALRKLRKQYKVPDNGCV